MYICEICGTKFSSDFTDESEAVLLIGLLTDLRRYLAAGQWLAPDICCYCFWSRRFHRYTQIFYGISDESLCPIPGGIFSSWDYFCPTDFTDIHRFFMESLVNRFVRSQGVSFLRGIIFVPQISQIYTDFLWNLW